MKGLSEKVTVSPTTGSADVSIPVSTIGIRGAPEIALAYSSSSGNTPFGLGWSLGTPQITRKTEKRLPEYAGEDVFILSGSEDLVEVERARRGDLEVTTYQPRTEGSHSWIRHFRDTGDPGNSWWQTISRENGTSWFGAYPDADGAVGAADNRCQISDPDDASRVFGWQIAESRDDRGNITRYHYKREDRAGITVSDLWEDRRHDSVAKTYLKAIEFAVIPGSQPLGGDFIGKLVFDYGDHSAPGEEQPDRPWLLRPDSFSDFTPGFEIRTRRLCRRILCFQRDPNSPADPGFVARSTDLQFDLRPQGARLTEVAQRSYRLADGQILSESLPPVRFTYSDAAPDDRVKMVDSDELRDSPVGLNAGSRFIDLDGNGLSGILTEGDNAWFYRENLGAAHLAPARHVAARPSFTNLDAGQITRLENDGATYLVSYAAAAGYAERDGENWSPVRRFASLPNIDFSALETRWIDLDGDGKPEVCLLHDEVISWYENNGEKGFGGERTQRTGADSDKGAARIFTNGLETIFTADMSGDGLTDIVRIRNGDVSYWPNLGYGRFGVRVEMAGAPRFASQDAFDPAKIIVGDIDGSGTADILYLGEDIHYWINASGNRFLPVQTIRSLPPSDQMAAVAIVDLLANGTSCLVWSSIAPKDAVSPWRYVALMSAHNLFAADVSNVGSQVLQSIPNLRKGPDGRADLTSLSPAEIRMLEDAGADLQEAVKPGLLIEVDNGMGKISRVSYRPSSYYFLKDKREGHPWATSLPFIIHVAYRQEQIDLVSGTRFVSCASFHHGYYDRAEREFRGFGRVDQWDMEGGLSGDVLFDRSPVLRRSWFHTGAWLRAATLTARFADEYHASPHIATLPDCEIENAADLNPRQYREAHRALRGQALHTELYSCDAMTPGAEEPKPHAHPHQVVQNRYRVRMVAPASQSDQPSVFQSLPLETVTFHIEATTDDPRVAHEMTLAVDEYGQVLLAASVAYGRNQTHAVDSEQAKTRIQVSEAEYINKPRQQDWHRIGVPATAKSWALSIDHPQGAALLLRLSDVLAHFQASQTQAVPHQAAAIASGQRKLLSAAVNLYRANADTGRAATPLPLGQVSSMALQCRSYALVYAPSDVEAADGHFSRQDFLDCKYTDPFDHALHPEHAGDVTLAAFLEALPETQDPQAGQRFSGWWASDGKMALDPAGFYQVTDAEDAWGNVSSIAYDPWFVVPVAVTDPLGNTVRAEYDPRTWQPVKITDANGAIQGARYDGFGRPMQTAVSQSLAGVQSGDALDTLEAFDPASTASSWMEYSFYQGPHAPAFVHSYARETHASELGAGVTSRWLESRTYINGFGREVLSKVRVANGPVDFGPPVAPGGKRWLGSGRTLFDNKGNPVKQYESYFTSEPAYGDGAPEFGVTPVLYYDPLDRPVRTELPDGTINRVEFSPWHQASWDAQDCAGEALVRQDIAASAIITDAGHTQTPVVAHFDSAGRPCFAQVTNYDPVQNATIGPLITRTAYDDSGNPVRIVDANGQIAQVAAFDMAGRPIKAVSSDAGISYALPALDGQPHTGFLPNGVMRVQTYDALRRPLDFLVTPDGGAQYLREAIRYGEQAPASLPNMRGKPWRIFDPTGMVDTAGYDFKGVPLASTRHVLAALTDAAQTPPSQIDWAQQGLTGAIAGLGESFVTSSRQDALGRPVLATAPDGSTQVFAYDRGGGMRTTTLGNVPGKAGAVPVVADVTYDQKGRRREIQYGNGVVTRYGYDPASFRLTRILSQHGADVLQDLKYRYDANGNIVEVSDDAQDAVIAHNQIIPPRRKFLYDSLNRLVEAAGREHVGQAGIDQTARPEGLAGPGVRDANGLSNYWERWTYDAIGNIAAWRHFNASESNLRWRRDYEYESQDGGAQPIDITQSVRSGPVACNRLTATTISPGSLPVRSDYAHDVAGNIVAFGHLTSSRWNVDDQPEEMTLHGNVTAAYRYDASGERLLKRVQTPGGGVSVRLYLGAFEIYREYGPSGALTMRRDSLHVMDGESRVLLIETEKKNDDASSALTPVWRWQMADHLGNACLELDENGAAVSYEEYHAYGTTAWHWTSTGVSQKRYRYTGMERDDESGFAYHSARYYLPWLGRWLSADPLGMVDGAGLYGYVKCKPISLHDGSGEYGEAGHYYTVLLVSLAAGFDVETSLRNAAFAQLPDEISFLDAINVLLPDVEPVWGQIVQQGMHALTYKMVADERLNTASALFFATPGTPLFGFISHRFGDTHAHSMKSESPMMIDLYGAGRNEYMTYPPVIGHGADEHAPDHIEDRPELYVEYGTSLYGNYSLISHQMGSDPRMSEQELITHLQSIAKIGPQTIFTVTYERFIAKTPVPSGSELCPSEFQAFEYELRGFEYSGPVKYSAEELQIDEIRALILEKFGSEFTEAQLTMFKNFRPEEHGETWLPSDLKGGENIPAEFLDGINKETLMRDAIKTWNLTR